MSIFDPKIKGHIHKYIFQCGLAMTSILVILVLLNIKTGTAIIASLGATTFIVFTKPNAYASRMRPLLGGYFVGIVVGIAFHYLSELTPLLSIFNERIIYIFCGAMAVGLSIFIMTITNTEHAPTAGVALGLVINEWDYYTILVIILTVIILFIVKKLLQPIMMDLI